MRYLRVAAAGHALLIDAVLVAQVSADPAGCPVLDLDPGAGRAEPASIYVIGTGGAALPVDAVHGMVDLADDALVPTPWLPEDCAALVDAVALVPIGDTLPWRLNPAALAAE